MSKLDEIEAILEAGQSEPGRLLSLAEDEDAEVRWRAIQGLGQFEGIDGVLARIRSALDDPDELVRCESVEILGAWKDRPSLARLQQLLNESSWMVRGAAAIAASGMGDASQAEALRRAREAAESSEERLRFDVALWRLGLAEFKASALGALSDAHYRTRCAAANLLAELWDDIGDDVALKAMKAALEKETTPAARSSLERAIEEIEAP